MPMKKVSRVLDVQKNSQIKISVTRVSDTDTQSYFKGPTWSLAVKMQQTTLGTSHLILFNSLVRVLLNLRNSGISVVMDLGAALVAQLFRMDEMMNQGRK